MVSLIITIVLTSLLFIIFKSYERFSVNTFQAVVANYFTCIVVGACFSLDQDINPLIQDLSWSWIALLMGGLFISTFYLMAWSAINIGVSVSTLSSKLSLIIPVLLSIWVMKTGEFSFKYLIGVLLIVLAILFTASSPKKDVGFNKKHIAYALVIFFMTGAVDASVNFSNFKFGYIEGFEKLFPVTVFVCAFVFGATKLILSKEMLEWKSIIGGVALGIPNYFSIYYLMKTLSEYRGNGAFVFPVINMSVIIMCAILARLLFHEKLTVINVLGLLCGVVAIGVISF